MAGACYLHPVCAPAGLQQEFSVCSIKLGLALSAACADEAGAPPRSGAEQLGAVAARQLQRQRSQVVVLLASNQQVVHESRMDATGAWLRFTVPAGVLQSGVASLYIAICSPDGATPPRLVDAGKLLVLPPDAAQEVRGLFQRTTQQIEALLRPTHQPLSASGSAGELAQPSSGARGGGGSSSSSSSSSSSNSGYRDSSSTPLQQQQKPRRQQGQRAPGAVQRVLSSLAPWAAATRRGPDSSRAAPSSSSSDSSSCSGATAAQPHQPSAAAPAGLQLQGAASGAPDAASLYVYEHFSLPFVRQWAAALHGSPSNSTRQHTAGAGGLPPGSAAAQATQLLSLLLDNDMWACCVLLLGKHPGLADRVSRSGLSGTAPHSAAAAALSPGLQPYGGGGMVPFFVQPHLPAPASATWPQLMGGLPGSPPPHALFPQAAVPGLVVLQQAGGSPSSPSTPSGDDSYEEASEILRRLGVLQHMRGEQESLLEAERAAAAAAAGRHEQQAQPMVAALPQAPEQQRDAPSPQVCAAGLLCGPHGAHASLAYDADAASSQGLRQRRAPVGGGLMSKPRKLSWEDELVEHPCCLRKSSLQLQAPAHEQPMMCAPAAASCGSMAAQLEQAAAVLGGGGAWRVDGSSSSSMVQQMQAAMEAMEQQAALAGLPLVGGCYAVQAPLAGVGAVAGLGGLPAPPAAGDVIDTGYSSCSLLEEMDRAISQGLHLPATHQQLAAGDLAGMDWSASASASACPTAVAPAAVSEIMSCDAQLAAADMAAADSTVAPAAAAPAAAAAAADAMSVSSAEDSVAAHAAAAPSSPRDDPLFWEQPCCGGLASSSAGHDDLPSSSSSSSTGACKAAAAAGARAADGALCSGGAPPHASRQSAAAALREAVLVALTGFTDPLLEASYAAFKNHGASRLDAMAGLLCVAMLAVATARSVRLAGGLWACDALLTLVLFGLLFFAPYITMHADLRRYLVLRELLYVASRVSSVLVLCAMVADWLPHVAPWTGVVVRTLALQLQNGVILPACQQVRLPAAAAIAAVHWPADAYYLALGRPAWQALLHSTLMQLSAITVSLVLDCLCRRRFLQRYAGTAQPPARHAPSTSAAAAVASASAARW